MATWRRNDTFQKYRAPHVHWYIMYLRCIESTCFLRLRNSANCFPHQAQGVSGALLSHRDRCCNISSPDGNVFAHIKHCAGWSVWPRRWILKSLLGNVWLQRRQWQMKTLLCMTRMCCSWVATSWYCLPQFSHGGGTIGRPHCWNTQQQVSIINHAAETHDISVS